MSAFREQWLPLLPGLLLAGPHPAGRTRMQTLRQCGELLRHGVRGVVNLAALGEGDEYEALLRQAALEEKALVRYERLPCLPSGMPDAAALEAALAGLGPQWDAGWTVYAHAGAMDARVALFAACAARFLKRGEEAALLDGLPAELRRFVGERIPRRR